MAPNADPIAHWIWQQPDWPRFRWDAETLAPVLRDCQQAQGRLLGMESTVAGDAQLQDELDTLLQNIITSSAIEGEELNAASVRSSLARRLGVVAANDGRATARSEGLAGLMLDATQHYKAPLDLPRLLHWHRLLFSQQDVLLPQPLRVGSLRGEEPIQVVSGRIDRPVVHFEAPPRDGLERQVDAFLDSFARSRDESTLHPLLRAGVAHFWFVTLHPFDDGFEQGITAAKYQAVAKVSKATATRHLADLLEKGYLERLPGGGRSTRYQIKIDNVAMETTNREAYPPSTRKPHE